MNYKTVACCTMACQPNQGIKRTVYTGRAESVTCVPCKRVNVTIIPALSNDSIVMHISHGREDVSGDTTNNFLESRQLHLTSLWEHILRTKTIPINVQTDTLFNEIGRRLRDPEWEVRQHALRVLADVIVVTENYSFFPLKSVVDNLGHNSPTVRKAALDALKIYIFDTPEPRHEIMKIVERCNYDKSVVTKNDIENNVITGILLSLPSLLSILKKRELWDSSILYPLMRTLGWRLFDVIHSDVAFRALVKLKKFCSPSEFISSISLLNSKIIDKYKLLCHLYDLDDDNESILRLQKHDDIVQMTRNKLTSESSGNSNAHCNQVCNCKTEDSPIIIQKDINFDSDTAITLTVLEEKETDEFNRSSEECCLSDSDKDRLNGLEETDLSTATQKRVRFGGEIVKVRTPDSENTTGTDDDISGKIKNGVSNINKKKHETKQKLKIMSKRSGIPLPILHTKNGKAAKKLLPLGENNRTATRLKSKSLTELYNIFRNNETPAINDNIHIRRNSILLTPPEKIPSPIEQHREVEVLHNLQRSPASSPPRSRRVSYIDEITDSQPFEMSSMIIANTRMENEENLTNSNKSLMKEYDWEKLNIIGKDIVNQLHNTDNWIGAVRAIDRLQRTLLDVETVTALENSGTSLVQHMWDLSEKVKAARAPAESVVCTLLRGASSNAARKMLPTVLERLCVEPLPAALPHALLSQYSLPELVRILLEWNSKKFTNVDELESCRLIALSCVARAAGPAATLAAVRRALPDSIQTDKFWAQLRTRLRKPSTTVTTEEYIPTQKLRVPSRLPVLLRSDGRKRAQSTPPATERKFSVRVRTTRDSAPPGGGFPVPENESLPAASISYANEEIITNNNSSKVNNAEIRSKDIPSSPVVAVHVNINEVDQDVTVTILDNQDVIESETKVQTTPSNSHVIHENTITETEADKNGPEFVEISSDCENDEVDNCTNSIKSTPERMRTVSFSTPPIQSRPQSQSSHGSNPYQQINNIEKKSPSPRHDSQSNMRDVRNDLNTYSTIQPRCEDWEKIVRSLESVQTLATDTDASAPASAWRAACRAAASHVRSPRSRVARAACRALAALFSGRARYLEPETDEAAGVLLDRTADVNRFLRADATDALSRVATGVASARAVEVLTRRGTHHRSGLVRAATAKTLADMASQQSGVERLLRGSPETRNQVIRAAADLFEDASADARSHARRLIAWLAEDPSFFIYLRESVNATKYARIEKSMNKFQLR